MIKSFLRSLILFKCSRFVVLNVQSNAILDKRIGKIVSLEKSRGRTACLGLLDGLAQDHRGTAKLEPSYKILNRYLSSNFLYVESRG
jgi:hypothetical protein